jgi:HK97 family phage portal protein
MFDRLRAKISSKPTTPAQTMALAPVDTLPAVPYRLPIATTGGIKATRIEDIFGGLFAGIESHQLFNYESYLVAGSKKCWALYKACDVISKVMMDTPLQLRKKGGNGDIVKNADLDRLLTVPNDMETFGEMIFKLGFHLELTGNGFWVKDEVNFQGQRPRQLFSLNPKRVRIVLDKDHGIKGYLYRVEGIGTEVPFETSEIIHFRIPHPNNDYWGLGIVEAAEDLFQTFINRTAWESKFWKNGASPSGVLICEDQVTDEANWKAAKLQWAKEYGGPENSGKTAWLTGKWKYEQLGLSNVEMENIEGSRWTVEQIFMQAGVPLTVAGLKDAANFATARQDDLRFRRYTVKPLLTFIQQTINSDLVEGFNPGLEAIFEIAGLVDLDNLRENFVPLFDRGAISINELRKMAGLMPDPSNPLWEQHFISAGLMPLELSGVADMGRTEEAQRGIIQRQIQALLNPQANGHARV